MRREKGSEDLVPGEKGSPLGSEVGDTTSWFYPDDGGRIWTKPAPTGLGVLQAAGAYPLTLHDGRMLLLCGITGPPWAPSWMSR
jgi:hypothetical protein